jgi:Ribbon-helix-helix protein, copG family
MPSKSNESILPKGAETEPGDTQLPQPRRINVAITPEMLDAIDRVIEREHVSLTEAVRRLLGYGEYIYRTIKEDGASIIVRPPEGPEKEIVLVV